MNLNGQEIQQLRDAVCAAFTEQEVIELMRFEMNVVLANVINVNQAFSAMVSDLIEWLT